MEIVADPLWGRDCLGYSVQARFSPATLDALAGIRDRRLARFPLPAHPIPTATLHTSVFSLAPVRWEYEDKAAFWASIEAAVLAELASLCRGAMRFTIPFDRLQATPTALILATAEQPPLVAALRTGLARLLTGSPAPPQRFDMTHVTLARPSRDGVLSDADLAALGQPPASLLAEVIEVALVRERRYPSLVMDDLVRFALTAPSASP